MVKKSFDVLRAYSWTAFSQLEPVYEVLDHQFSNLRCLGTD